MARADRKHADLDSQRRAAVAVVTGMPVEAASDVLDETIHANGRTLSGPPPISIASPYFKDDPSAWINRLARTPEAARCEVVLVDDGSGDAEIDARVRAAIDAWPGPARLIRFHHNRGRSSARNRAIAAAEGTFILFIDADMLPGDDRYLARYLDLIATGSVDMAYGGFTSHGTPVTRETRLHYNLTLHSDCKPASERSPRGPIAVATNNLLARRSIFEQDGFDPNYIGWGWEDTEWAIRAVKHGARLAHVDNPAIHTGLDTNEAVLRKFREAAGNLRQLVQAHPDAGVMDGVKIARLLSKTPGQTLLRPVAHWVACDPSGLLPMVIRRMAAKFWRASWAAESLG